jgi:hypothetical protein
MAIFFLTMIDPVMPSLSSLQVFATFDYMPTEYERQRIISKFERLQNKLAQVTPNEFVVKAPPSAPKGAPAFSEFLYVSDVVSAEVCVRCSECRSGVKYDKWFC